MAMMRTLIALFTLIVFSAIILVAAEPKDFAGSWKVQAPRPDGSVLEVMFKLQEKEGKLSGVLVAPGGEEVPLESLKVEGEEMVFTLPTENGMFTIRGQRDGEGMKGTFKDPGGNGGSWTATKAS